MNLTRILGTLMLVAATAMGCSGVADPDLQEGSLTDPTFTQGQAQWEAAIAQAVGSIDLAMDYSFVAPSDTINPIRNRNVGHSANAAVDTFTYSYDVVTGWHVAAAVFSDSGITGNALDSVQFQDAAGQVMQDFSDVTTDQIHAIQAFDIATDDTALFAIDLAAQSDLAITNITSGIATVNGTFDLNFALTIADTGNSCLIAYDFTQTLNSIVFPIPAAEQSGICPTSGSMHLTGAIGAACTGGDGSQNVNETWTIDVVFNNDGTMTIAAQTGNTVWNYSGDIPCGNYDSPL